MSDSGSIGSKVVSELAGIVKDTGKQLTEVVLPNTPSGSPPYKGGEEEIKKKRAEEQRRFNQVKQELDSYIANKKRQDQQVEQVKEQEHMEEIQKRESQKKQKENSLIGKLSRQYGGTGEIGKGKY